MCPVSPQEGLHFYRNKAKLSAAEHLFRRPDFVQVHQFDLFASSAITATGAGEGHGAFSAAVEIVSGMKQLFLSEQGSVFRVIQVEPDRAEIMA